MTRSPWLPPAVAVVLLAAAGSIVIGARDAARRGELPVLHLGSAR